MTRDEFKNQVVQALPKGKIAPELTDKEYKMIEQVYTFHPSISETEGKTQIAMLYVNFGMSIIRDMTPRARLMEEKEQELREIHIKMEKVMSEIKEIRAGGAI